MVSPAVLDVRIPTGCRPTCGVLLEPYVVYIEEGADGVLSNISDEFGPPHGGNQSRLRLRSRWFRQRVDDQPSCSMHPDRKATVQCILCVKHRVPMNLSYQCSGECLHHHWRLHQALHEQYHSINDGNFPWGYSCTALDHNGHLTSQWACVLLENLHILVQYPHNNLCTVWSYWITAYWGLFLRTENGSDFEMLFYLGTCGIDYSAEGSCRDSDHILAQIMGKGICHMGNLKLSLQTGG